jgi:hypothetical protein
MGYYINPEDPSKENWLTLRGVKITPQEAKDFVFEENPDSLPVCLIDNGAFFAAGIAYDEREKDCFIAPDGRTKQWYKVPKEALKPWYNA